jgi:hypothetical protein
MVRELSCHSERSQGPQRAPQLRALGWWSVPTFLRKSRFAIFVRDTKSKRALYRRCLAANPSAPFGRPVARVAAPAQTQNGLEKAAFGSIDTV